MFGPWQAGLNPDIAYPCDSISHVTSTQVYCVIPAQNYLNVIPAKTKIHCPTTPMPEKNTPSFPRRQKSIVPLPQCPKKILRHSREGGNPQFPRTREFNENTIQTDQTPHYHTGLPRHPHTDENPPHPSFPRRSVTSFPSSRE